VDEVGTEMGSLERGEATPQGSLERGQATPEEKAEDEAVPVLNRLWCGNQFSVAYIAMMFVACYAMKRASGCSLKELQEASWFLPEVEALEFYTIWEYAYDVGEVQWDVVGKQLGMILVIVFFNILTNIIDIVSLEAYGGDPPTVAAGDTYSMDRELGLFSFVNVLCALCGAWPAYMTTSPSLIYNQACGPRGANQFGGLVYTALCVAFLLVGPSPSGYIPRCVIAYAPLEMGYDLVSHFLGRSALKKTTWTEYLNMWLIAVLMIVWGFVEGIIVGTVMAFIRVVIELSRTATIFTVRNVLEHYTSSKISDAHQKIIQTNWLEDHAHVLCPEGNIFFGNAPTLAKRFNELVCAETTDCIIVFLKHVCYIDRAGYETLEEFRRRALRQRCLLLFCDANRADLDPATQRVIASPGEDGRGQVDLLKLRASRLRETPPLNPQPAPASVLGAEAKTWSDWADREEKPILLHGVESASAPYTEEELRQHFSQCDLFAKLIAAPKHGTRYYGSLDEAMAACEQFIIDLYTANYYERSP